MARNDAAGISYPNIRDIIRGLTLFSDELTGVFKRKEYTIYTLKALSVLEDIPEEMEKEMRIDVQEWTEKPVGSRGARLDALVTFRRQRISIEIQRAERGDEIPRATFYASRIASDLEEGLRRIPESRTISLWICGFDPFPGEGLPYYVFTSRYKTRDGIRGTEDGFEMGNGVEYIFVNGAYDWEMAGAESPLTGAEQMLRDYVSDMRQSDPEAMVSDIARDVLSVYKEGGAMYDKIEEAFKERFADDYKKAEEIGKKEGISIGREGGISIGEKQGKVEMVKAMLSEGSDLDFISKVSGLSKEEILTFCK